MRQKSEIAILIVALVIVGILAGPTAMGQNAAPPSLEEQLEAQYKLAKLANKSGQTTVTEPGTVLVIQKAGIQGVPPKRLVVLAATYVDGVLHPPSKKAGFGAGFLHGMSKSVSKTSGNDSRQLPVGEKVYVSKIDVNVKNEKIGFRIVECDTCNGVTEPSSYKGEVIFQFAKGYLETADVSKVEDTIGEVFALDTSKPATQAQQPAGQPEQPAPAQPAAAEAPPPSIQLGQTIDQVVAVLGQPEKTVNLGSKQIYVYKDLKVTFVNGKVSDVQ